MKGKVTARTSLHAIPSRLRTMHDLPERQSVIHHRIEGKRQLLTEEILHYFGDTCPALAKRCETAIVGLRPPGRREAANCLQMFSAVSNEANRELAAARFAASTGHLTVELLDRARASIQHLDEVAQAVAHRIDELMEP
jgi:hypothetical protein